MSAFTHAISTNNYGLCKFIVSSSAANGTHTTIQAAINAASSGDTIGIRAGTYTENPVLIAGINLVSLESAVGADPYGALSSGNVIINGKVSYTAAGNAGIFGIVLQTNSDYAISVSGSAASKLAVNNCYIKCLNHTGILLSSSSSSSLIDLVNCGGNLDTTAIGIFDHSGAGNLRWAYTQITNIGSSTQDNTVSGTGRFDTSYSKWQNGTTFSSSSSGQWLYPDVQTSNNLVTITTSSTANVQVIGGALGSGNNNVVVVGAGTTVALFGTFLTSSAASTVTGTGTLQFTNLTFNSGANLNAGLTLSLGAMNNFISAGGVGTAGQVLTSNGSVSPPTFQSAGANAFASINVQTFTNSGTYTPTAGMLYCIIECVGGGGGGGATTTTGVGTVTCGGGGGGGGYARKFVSAATIGASKTVTIGAGGTAGAAAGGSGGTGGTTSVGTLCVATGGAGASGGAANTGSQGYTIPGAAGGVGTTGDILSTGQGGGAGIATGVNYSVGGAGGSSYFGGGAQASATGGASVQNAGTAYGGGGSGCATGGGGNTQGNGGAGFAGVVIITEFI